MNSDEYVADSYLQVLVERRAIVLAMLVCLAGTAKCPNAHEQACSKLWIDVLALSGFQSIWSVLNALGASKPSKPSS